MTDPIADMLTRIRNAYLAHKATCVVPHSKLKNALAHTLAAEGFLDAVSESDTHPKTLTLTLKYHGANPALTRIVRSSKPGRREYVRVKKIASPLSGYGVSIVSTSKGLMTDKAARKANLGGELICRIY